jgi:integrase/recombinase XerD
VVEGLPISVLVEQWLAYIYHRKHRTESTINTYRSVIGFFVDFAGDCDVNELSVSLVDRYAESLLKENLAPKTYRNRLIPIRSFVSYLFSKDYLDLHPSKLEVPPDTTEEANFLTPDELKRMLKACRNMREYVVIMFFANSGLRVSELVNLRKDDIYMRSVVVRLGKGRKNRVTFIDHETDSTLKQYHSTLGYDSIYAFPNRSGSAISRQYITRIISEVSELAGINKRVSAHTLRHTFATSMLMKGSTIEEVQKMLGHANIRTTLIYLHFTNEYLHSRYDEVNGVNPRDKTEIVLTRHQINKIKNSKSTSLVLT